MHVSYLFKKLLCLLYILTKYKSYLFLSVHILASPGYHLTPLPASDVSLTPGNDVDGQMSVRSLDIFCAVPDDNNFRDKGFSQ